MQICGFNKTTLLDYPGKVAATIFLGGCNFRCPFCQNRSLVLEAGEQPSLDPEEVLAFLQKRKGILEGICITGGEPTLSKGLPAFLAAVHDLGYPVKLDTNGTHPEVVRALAEDGLIAKAAMDIKACPENYAAVAGVKAVDMDAIRETADYLMNGPLDYEFRTTVVKELHTAHDFEVIADWLSGAKEYYLQEYRDSEGVIRRGFTGCTLEEMQAYQAILARTIPKVGIRGID